MLAGSFFNMNGNRWVVSKYAFIRSGSHAVLWHGRASMEKLFLYDPNDDAFVPTGRVNAANQVVCVETIRDGWPPRTRTVDTPKRLGFLWDPARGQISLNDYLPDRTCQFNLCDFNNRGSILGIAWLEDADGYIPILPEPMFSSSGDQPDEQSSTEVALGRQ